MPSSVRKYYSVRNSKRGSTIALDSLRKLIFTIYEDFNSNGYFIESFGSTCVDMGYTPGKAGLSVKNYVLKSVRKDLWPLDSFRISTYSEEDLFDMVEFLFDHVSKPIEEGGSYHNWMNCGWHYEKFDQTKGKDEFRGEVNIFIADYLDGFELSSQGEILTMGEPHMKNLLNVELPSYDPKNVESKVRIAVNKYRKYGASTEDREDAVRTLASIFEFIRPKIKATLKSKDDDDLFNIANNFAIRHSNDKQKNDYDKSVWLSWMFYFYLSTLHACLRFRVKQE